MKLHIMTWNCALYNQPESEKSDEIFGFIKNQLNIENSIVILQEIPYKEWGNWKISKIYQALLNNFPENAYSIKFNIHNNYQIMMTVAITKGANQLNCLNESFYPIGTPRNREIAVEYHGISFLGIHAENGKDNERYLNAIPGKADIILGDFNAGNYLDSENRNIFNQILNEHICICNMPTKVTKTRRTCIDHVFIKEDMITNCSNLIVHEEMKLSDHFPITFEYEIK
ncbi:hypothetical protein LJC61_04755 [Ruminococcaceae bacterium OttesenSCG-928-A16]|nr:hypothetical protein [Ruminococcaceae bacterium OttesenSCG-928-A16]